MKKIPLAIVALNFSLLGGGISACPSLTKEQVNTILQIYEYSDHTGVWELEEPERTNRDYPLDKSVHLDEGDADVLITEPDVQGEYCHYTVLYAPIEGHQYTVGKFTLHKKLSKNK